MVLEHRVVQMRVHVRRGPASGNTMSGAVLSPSPRAGQNPPYNELSGSRFFRRFFGRNNPR